MKSLVVLFLSVLLLSCIRGYGQEDYKKKLEKIEKRLLVIDSTEHSKISVETENAFGKVKDLKGSFNVLKTKSDFSDLFTELNKAVNPNNSNILGESYTDVIKKEAKDLLTVDLEAKAKEGFGEILNKITSIPVIGELINTNPIASMASSVISSASNFLTQKLSTDRGKKVLKYGQSIKKDKIDEFAEKIKPFVEYYDAVLVADNLFNQQNILFNKRLNSQIDSLINSESRLNHNFQIDKFPTVSKALYNYFRVEGDNYYKVLIKQEVQAAYKIVDDITKTELILKEYEKEFSNMFSLYLNTYIVALNNLKKSDLAQEYETEEIDRLIKLIMDYNSKYGKGEKSIDELENKINIDNSSIYKIFSFEAIEITPAISVNVFK